MLLKNVQLQIFVKSGSWHQTKGQTLFFPEVKYNFYLLFDGLRPPPKNPDYTNKKRISTSTSSIFLKCINLFNSSTTACKKRTPAAICSIRIDCYAKLQHQEVYKTRSHSCHFLPVYYSRHNEHANC